MEVINPLFLLSAKPVVYLVNLSEKDYIRQKNKHLSKVAEWIKTNSPGEPIIPISVAFEERLTQLGGDAEVEEECKKLSTKSILPKVITTMRQALHLNSFFTTGADEVRQWTIREGTKAPQAAGVIHGGAYKPISCRCAITKRSANSHCSRQTSRRPLSKQSSTITKRLKSMVTKQQ